MNSKKSDEPNKTQDQQTPSEVYKLTSEKYLKNSLLRKKIPEWIAVKHFRS